jgi:hypothetical protein
LSPRAPLAPPVTSAVSSHSFLEQKVVGSECAECISDPPVFPSITIATSLGGLETSTISTEGRFVGYRCPHCGEGGLETLQEAVEHCAALGWQGGKSVGIAGQECQRSGETVSQTFEKLNRLPPEDVVPVPVASTATVAPDWS